MNSYFKEPQRCRAQSGENSLRKEHILEFSSLWQQQRTSWEKTHFLSGKKSSWNFLCTCLLVPQIVKTWIRTCNYREKKIAFIIFCFLSRPLTELPVLFIEHVCFTPALCYKHRKCFFGRSQQGFAACHWVSSSCQLVCVRSARSAFWDALETVRKMPTPFMLFSLSSAMRYHK